MFLKNWNCDSAHLTCFWLRWNPDSFTVITIIWNCCWQLESFSLQGRMSGGAEMHHRPMLYSRIVPQSRPEPRAAIDQWRAPSSNGDVPWGAAKQDDAPWASRSILERPRRPSPWDEAVRPARQGRSSAWRFADQFSLVCCQNDLHESLFINYPRSLWTWCLQMCRCHTLIFDFVTTRVVQRACPLLTANDVKYWLFLKGLLMTKVLNSQCDSKQATYFNMIVMCAYHKRI